MGYYFKFEHLNMITSLVNNNVARVVKDIINEKELQKQFYELILDLDYNLLTTNPNEIPPVTKELLKTYGKWGNSNGISENVVQLSDYKGLIRKTKFSPKSINNQMLKSLSFNELVQVLAHRMSSFEYKFLVLKERDYQEQLLEKIIENYHYNFSSVFLQPTEMPGKTLELFNVAPNFEKILRNMDNLPGVLVWKNDNKPYFVRFTKTITLDYILNQINTNRDILPKLEQLSLESDKVTYLIQISDLHIGIKNTFSKLNLLLRTLENKIKSLEKNSNKEIVITGDFIDEPNEELFSQFELFFTNLKTLIDKAPMVIMGNHDISKHGIHGLSTEKKATAIATTLFHDNMKILDNNIMMLLFNSNTGGELAQGKIGNEQMIDFNNKISSVSDESKYTKIALVHHHINKIPYPEWMRKKWYEKIFPLSTDASLKMVDSTEFGDWLDEHKVRLVLHGHKHIPYFADDIIKSGAIVGCGSSTGNIRHTDKTKTYISYNLIKISRNHITINQFAQEYAYKSPKVAFTTTINRKVE